MKNLIKTIILLFTLFMYNNLKAQICEFDKIVNDQNYKGFKILETKSKQILIAGIKGYMYNIQTPDHLKHVLTKMDKCGNVLWSISPDSSIGRYAQMDLIDLIEEENGDLMVIVYYFNRYSSISVLRNEYIYFKLDSNGNLKWRKNTNEIYVDKYKKVYSTEKISNNSYLFLTAIDSNNISTTTQINIYDTLGNLLLTKNIDTTTQVQQKIFITHLKNDTTIMVAKAENNNVKLINLDLAANVKENKIIYTPVGFNLLQILFNQTKTEILITSNKAADTSLYVARYNLEGVLISDTLLVDTAFKKAKLYYSDSNLNVFINNYSYVMPTDANYKIFWKDYTQNSGINHKLFDCKGVVKTHDNSLIILGNQGTSGGMSSQWYWSFVKKMNITKFIKTITISGANSINTQGGLLQLTAAILPGNAANQQIIWSVNDTNLATITQTGLVTAKANGTVLVKATAADGGGATATKTITITNQTVGINEVNLNNQIAVYPNPASNVLTIKTTSNLVIQQLQLLEITGKVIAQYHNQTEIDVSAIANGIYLLQIQTTTGNAVKQVVINK